MPTEPLTDDEFTVLMIAHEGESMMPIGRWQRPVESLVSKGLLARHDKFNNTITAAGRKAIAERDRQDNAAIRQVIEKGKHLAGVQHELQSSAEKCAQTLVAMANASVIVTGDSLDTAVDKWAEAVRKRAIELLDESGVS